MLSTADRESVLLVKLVKCALCKMMEQEELKKRSLDQPIAYIFVYL